MSIKKKIKIPSGAEEEVVRNCDLTIGDFPQRIYVIFGNK